MMIFFAMSVTTLLPIAMNLKETNRRPLNAICLTQANLVKSNNCAEDTPGESHEAKKKFQINEWVWKTVTTAILKIIVDSKYLH